MLDSTDIEILLALQKNPLSTLGEIANQINMSISNTSARIYKLENEYKAFRRIQVDLNLPALELEHHDFFLEVESKKTLYYLEEKFCHFHPYVTFRDRCTGALNGLFIQFQIPRNTLANISEILDILQKRGHIVDYQHVVTDQNEVIIRSNSALDYWDKNAKKWIFDWVAWQENFNNASSSSQPISKIESILDQFTDIDIKLLAQLTKDARKKNVEMMANIGLKNEAGVAQKVSRRVRFLKDHAIANYRLNLNWRTFDLFHSILIQGKCKKSLAMQIRNYLMVNDQENKPRLFTNATFPFPCFFKITNDGYLWFVRAPPIQLSQLINFVWDICPDYNLYLLSYRYSQVYSLWDETFDSTKKYWKTTNDFMIDNVIDQMSK
jgi:DNA-binding Lrp family transcriptional regulator